MSDEEEVIVEIPQGKLRGKKEKSIFGTEFYCFHRIPYAKPPVGELRFKAPQPADGWADIRDATTEGSVCPSADWQDRTKYLQGCDEDSLFINVFLKKNPNAAAQKKWPVLVWIHGGGFEFGSGNRHMSGPDYFMLYDVIFVTFNYRLGALGFLSLQTVECPGNFGLKDQQLALRWVKNNIGNFGGDEDNITIFGISAGGASVHYQTLSLSNEGLFKKAIAQSGTAFSKWAFARCPRENAFLLGKRLGCDHRDDTVLLEYLRKASAEDIVLNAQGIINETEGLAYGEDIINMTFVPTAEPEHDGAFITKHPWVAVKEGPQLDVPLITGICSQEMIFALGDPNKYPRPEADEEFQMFIPKNIQLEKNGRMALTIAKRLKDFYFKDGVQLESYLDLLSDIYFNYGAYKIIKTRRDCRSPTYLYFFTYKGDQKSMRTFLGLTEIEGTSHGEDSSYLTYNFLSDMEKMCPGSRDYNFMTKFTQLWVNFATTGVPVLVEPGFSWTKTSPQNLEYLDLGEKFVMKKGLLKDRMFFWDEIYTSYYDN